MTQLVSSPVLRGSEHKRRRRAAGVLVAVATGLGALGSPGFTQSSAAAAAPGVPSQRDVADASAVLPVATGEGSDAARAAPLAGAARRLDPPEVEAFVDGLMASYLEESAAVGGVVAVVENGEVVLAKGYGEADRERGIEVDPDRTLFRVGSITKLFVWTAVMQLVEQGELDLDADVNGYLDGVEIPETYPEPVTLTHLMTHTAGFEDRVLGLFARDASTLRPLGELLAAELPARVRPPGVFASYSNHGSALAMLIVEQVSGVPWLEYVGTRILEPLGMRRTTFLQPVPPPLLADVSVGYRQPNGGAGDPPGPVADTFEYVPLAPAGAASATASDMARFMVAHLDHGRLGEARILGEAAARRMQSTLHRHEPTVSGMAHGFIEGDRNGHRVIGHGGDTLWFHSLVELYPEARIGLFASFNTAGAQPQKLAEAFADRYFPAPEWRAPPAPSDWDQRALRFTGSYRSLRYSHHDLTKLVTVMSQLEVTDAGGGALIVSAAPDSRFVQVEPYLFREEGGTSSIAFRAGPDGIATHVFVGDVPVFAFERVPWYESAELHGPLFGSVLLVFLATVASWPAGLLLRWRYQLPAARRTNRLPLLPRAVVWLACLAFVAFFAGLALSLPDPFSIVFGLTPRLRQVLQLPIAGTVLAVMSLLCFLWMWRGRRGGTATRVAYALVVVALFVVVWQLAVWRLLGAQG